MSQQRQSTENQQHSAIWFRQDLRLADNQAFTSACQWAREHQGRVRGLYIATPSQWQQHDVAAIQLDFIERHLNLLSQGLACLGIELDVVQLDDFASVPDFMASYCLQHHIAKVFAGAEPEWNERQRDKAV
ncbi:MAG TPA: deoxyribodipyrimidine photo-lyase, partial [Pseudomonadales bacterium]|nr:deoxyribodipyrimidine photo-lyase [Pseudomonadales bacterium]